LITAQKNHALDQILLAIKVNAVGIRFGRLAGHESAITEDLLLPHKLIIKNRKVWMSSGEEEWIKLKNYDKGFVLGSTHDKLLMTQCIEEQEFDVAIVDEGSQSSLLDLLHILTRSKKIILIGDHKQLQPFGMQKQIGEVDIKKQKTFDAIDFFSASPLKDLQKGAFSWVMLSTHYRSHFAIGRMISQVFYDGRFACHRSDEAEDPNVLRIVDTSKLSEERGDSKAIFEGHSSTINSFEVKKIIEELKAYKKRKIDFSKVGVITFYNAQVELIKEELKNHFSDDDIDALRVATVDSFQGKEKKHLIISFVRSNNLIDIGFLDLMERRNVALSRAKDELLLIGDFKMLTTDSSLNPSSSLFRQIVHYISEYRSGNGNGNGNHLNNHSEKKQGLETAI